MIKKGATRTVWLIGKYAFKFPRFYSFRNFLNGILGNMQEVEFSAMKDDRMCPVLFYIPCGLMIVMPRCSELTEKEFDEIDIDYFWEQEFKVIDNQTIYYGDCVVPVEHKKNSFGWYRGNSNRLWKLI